MHHALSAARFRSWFEGLAAARFWIIFTALVGLGLACHRGCLTDGQGIAATLHRKGTASGGVPVELGKTIELKPGEIVFYSLEFKAEGDALQFDIRGRVSRVLVSGREMPEYVKNLKPGGDGRGRLQIETREFAGSMVRLDLWLAESGGVVEVDVIDDRQLVLGRLAWLFLTFGSFGLFAAGAAAILRLKRLWLGRSVPRKWLSAACVLPGIASVFVFRSMLFHPHDVRVQVGNQSPVPVTLPHNGVGEINEVSVYRGVFDYGILTDPELQVVPDDYLLSLSINGRELDLSHIPAWKLRDWINGFTLSIRPYVHPGKNTFEVAVANTANPYGLRLKTPTGSSYHRLGLGILAAGACLFLCGLWPWLGLRKSIMLLLFGAVILRVAYASYTGPRDRGYDVEGHLDHINYILARHELPPRGACWECHQPTLYYLLGGAGLLAGRGMELGSPENFLQAMAIFFSVIFLIAGAKMFQLIVPRYATACCALLFFWPSGVIHSVRVSNDVPFYAFYAVSLLFAMQWAREGRTRDMVFSALAAAFTVLTKITGLSLLPVLVSIWLARVWHRKNRTGGVLIRQTVLAMLIIGSGLAVLYKDKLYDRWNLSASERIAPGVQTLPAGLAVENHLRNYFVFDLRDFLEEPYTNPWADPGGRQFFLNFFWKTSLFAEFRHTGPGQAYVAHMIKGLLLVLLAVAAAGIVAGRRLGPDVRALCFGLSFFSVAGVLLFRSNAHFSCNQDFRFVYPMCLAIIVLVANGFDFLAETCGRGWRRCFGVLTIAWVILNITFFALPCAL